MGAPEEMTVREGKASAVEQVIARYRRTYRRRLRRLAQLADSLADVLTSFPAVAIAIVADYGSVNGRALAVQRIKGGEPLKAVAKAIGLPYWMRKLPPEAFGPDFPRQMPAAFVTDEGFGSRVIGLLPDARDRQPAWLRGVLECYRLAGPEVAHWLARHPQLSPANGTLEAVRFLALFAWVSRRGESYAAKLLPGKWSDKASPERAVANAIAWAERLENELVLGPRGLADTWLVGCRAGAYKFVPLTTLVELKAEGEALNHCVADYANALAMNECRVFGVRRGNVRVATVEIRPSSAQAGIPVIVQMRGANNDDVPVAVWKAAFEWLAKQPDYKLPSCNCPDCRGGPMPDATTWRELWRPYWREMGPHPLLPETATAETLTALAGAARQLHGLARG